MGHELTLAVPPEVSGRARQGRIDAARGQVAA